MIVWVANEIDYVDVQKMKALGIIYSVDDLKHIVYKEDTLAIFCSKIYKLLKIEVEQKIWMSDEPSKKWLLSLGKKLFKKKPNQLELAEKIKFVRKKDMKKDSLEN